MNKSLAIILVLILFFLFRYILQTKNEETMMYEEVQVELNNVKKHLGLDNEY